MNRLQLVSLDQTPTVVRFLFRRTQESLHHTYLVKRRKWCLKVQGMRDSLCRVRGSCQLRRVRGSPPCCVPVPSLAQGKLGEPCSARPSSRHVLPSDVEVGVQSASMRVCPVFPGSGRSFSETLHEVLVELSCTHGRYRTSVPSPSPSVSVLGSVGTCHRAEAEVHLRCSLYG